MKKIEAQTLEEALIIATSELNCSVVDLEYVVIQNPTNGFLGIGRKSAIICAKLKQESKAQEDFTQAQTSHSTQESHFTQATHSTQTAQESQESHKYAATLNDSMFKDYALRDSAFKTKENIESQKIRQDSQKPFEAKFDFKDEDKFYKSKKTFSKEELRQISKEVEIELKELLALLPYRLNEIFVEPYDENTLYIKIDGEDSALLIGKEGYRYKAISYLIFNWVNHAYGLMIRLEIAEFLQNQEEMIANYLVPTIESVKLTGKAQTKPLDGVLAHIALKQLRERFPDKYVSFRLNSEGERYIIINDFYRC